MAARVEMTAALTTMRIARADIGHVFDRIRATVPHYVDDRPMMADIEAELNLSGPAAPTVNRFSDLTGSGNPASLSCLHMAAGQSCRR